MAFPSLALVVLLFITACHEPSAPKFSRPPVILVDIDTLRADHLGCYGYHRPTSPAIDRFSQEAIRFHWAFSQAPNTPPSQTSILTSLYPTTHGRFGDKQIIPDEITTLAEAFKEAGYATGAFVDGGLMAKGFGLEQGFDVYNDDAGGVRKIGPKVEEWIEDREEPFFLLVHSYDTHSPYEVTPEPYRSIFLDEVEELPAEDYRNNMSRDMAAIWKKRYENPPPQLTPQELDYAIAMYDGGIRHVDAWFEGFMSFLRESGIYEQAIIVFISDHGDSFQEHGDLFHERIYSSITRIPFMIRFPGGEPRGVFDQVVESIDLMPTLLDALGLKMPTPMHGSSLLPLVTKGEPPTNVAITESPYWGRRLALTTPQYRLIHTGKTNEIELYRYREDPMEQEDLAAAEQEVARRLQAGLERWDEQVRATRFKAAEAEELDPETIEQLRTLGYLD